MFCQQPLAATAAPPKSRRQVIVVLVSHIYSEIPRCCSVGKQVVVVVVPHVLPATPCCSDEKTSAGCREHPVASPGERCRSTSKLLLLASLVFCPQPLVPPLGEMSSSKLLLLVSLPYFVVSLLLFPRRENVGQQVAASTAPISPSPARRATGPTGAGRRP